MGSVLLSPAEGSKWRDLHVLRSVLPLICRGCSDRKSLLAVRVYWEGTRVSRGFERENLKEFDPLDNHKKAPPGHTRREVPGMIRKDGQSSLSEVP